MHSRFEQVGKVGGGRPGSEAEAPRSLPGGIGSHVLVVEDDALIRDALGPLLDGAGYRVSFAENGQDALRQLHDGIDPHLIVFDLKMPVMNGWEFRTIQKDDPRLGHIPVVALSADFSAQAAAISAQAYLRKPVGAQEFLSTIERILAETKRQQLCLAEGQERLATLGQLAAGVGHGINNPLAVVMLNLGLSLRDLEPAILSLETPLGGHMNDVEADHIRVNLLGIAAMLEDCQAGGERIRTMVETLQRLATQAEGDRALIDIHTLLDAALSRVSALAPGRVRVTKLFGRVPTIRGNLSALQDVFWHVLLNAAESLADEEHGPHEIRVSTSVQTKEQRAELVVTIEDSGMGMSSEVVPQIFDPFFTTKPVGAGAGKGLGLSVSRQTVIDHGGRITVESELTKGTKFRIFLPLADVSPIH